MDVIEDKIYYLEKDLLNIDCEIKILDEKNLVNHATIEEMNKMIQLNNEKIEECKKKLQEKEVLLKKMLEEKEMLYKEYLSQAESNRSISYRETDSQAEWFPAASANSSLSLVSNLLFSVDDTGKAENIPATKKSKWQF